MRQLVTCGAGHAGRFRHILTALVLAAGLAGVPAGLSVASAPPAAAAAGGVSAAASAAAARASANVEISTPKCGVVEFGTSATGSWVIPGGGVDVFSNGPSKEGTGSDCTTSTSKVGGVVAGQEWQCVEFVNRLYLTRGWITGPQGGTTPAWRGDAGPAFYNDAPPNLTEQRNGSVAYLGPGDVVIDNVYKYGSPDGGHALVVDDTSDVTNGTVNLVSQNSGYQGNSEPVVTGKISGGSVTVGGGDSEWTYSVIGVVHAPTGGSGATSGLTAARDANGDLEVFATGPGGVVYHDWQLSPNGATGWSGWGQLAASTGFTSLAVGVDADGDLEVFATSPSGVVYHDWQLSPNGATGWSGWGELASGSP
jgi:hypothetical protein